MRKSAEKNGNPIIIQLIQLNKTAFEKFNIESKKKRPVILFTFSPANEYSTNTTAKPSG